MITWVGAAGVLAFAGLAGVAKLLSDLRAYRISQMRDKAPWERAMDELNS